MAESIQERTDGPEVTGREGRTLGKYTPHAQTKEGILYRLVDGCTAMMGQIATSRHARLVDDAARAFEGRLVAFPNRPLPYSEVV